MTRGQAGNFPPEAALLPGERRPPGGSSPHTRIFSQLQSPRYRPRRLRSRPPRRRRWRCRRPRRQTGRPCRSRIAVARQTRPGTTLAHPGNRCLPRQTPEHTTCPGPTRARPLRARHVIPGTPRASPCSRAASPCSRVMARLIRPPAAMVPTAGRSRLSQYDRAPARRQFSTPAALGSPPSRQRRCRPGHHSRHILRSGRPRRGQFRRLRPRPGRPRQRRASRWRASQRHGRPIRARRPVPRSR